MPEAKPRDTNNWMVLFPLSILGRKNILMARSIAEGTNIYPQIRHINGNYKWKINLNLGVTLWRTNQILISLCLAQGSVQVLHIKNAAFSNKKWIISSNGMFGSLKLHWLVFHKWVSISYIFFYRIHLLYLPWSTLLMLIKHKIDYLLGK